jgi:hypothetical protein
MSREKASLSGNILLTLRSGRYKFGPMVAKRKNRYAQALGRKGGRVRAKRLTAEQRSEAARQAVKARWAKAKDGRGGKPG